MKYKLRMSKKEVLESIRKVLLEPQNIPLTSSGHPKMPQELTSTFSTKV